MYSSSVPAWVWFWVLRKGQGLGWGIALVKHWIQSPAKVRVVFCEPSHNWKTIPIENVGMVGNHCGPGFQEGRSWRLSSYIVYAFLIRLSPWSTESERKWPKCGWSSKTRVGKSLNKVSGNSDWDHQLNTSSRVTGLPQEFLTRTNPSLVLLKGGFPSRNAVSAHSIVHISC